MTPEIPYPRSLLEAFHRKYREDREAGTVRQVREYLDLYPGDDEGLVRAYVALRGGVEGLPAGDDLECIGPYRTLRELGRGGQGIVYLAEDSRLHRKVALKVLTGLGPGSEATVRRFRREAEVASRLQHPGICGVFDAGMDKGVCFIAMQLIQGETLAEWIEKTRTGPFTQKETSIVDLESAPAASAEPVPAGERAGQPPPSRIVTKAEVLRIVGIFEDAARALHAAHEAGIVHRDIKPGNVMVTEGGRPVILDFGLARADDEDFPTLTRTGDLLGTPAYMSPEQISRGTIRLDRRTDVYSLAATLFECLTLRRPFEAPTREALYHLIMTKDPPGLRELNPRIPRELEIVVETALEKDRDRRYQTAEDLAEDLRRIREHEPIQAKPITVGMRLVRWAQRNPAVAALTAAVFLVLAGGMTAALVLLSQVTDQRNRADANAQNARAKLADWDRLADGRRLEDLLREADQELWPAVPEKTGAMAAWLARARALAGRLEDVRVALTALRSRAHPGSGGPAAPPSGRTTWDFGDDARAQLQHDKLEDLVRRLEHLTGTPVDGEVTIQGIEQRLETARSLGSRTLDAARPAWSAAIARVAGHPAYGDLELKPRLGLVPLGPDSDSGLEEFCETQTGDPPARDDAGRLRLSETTALVFVLVPGGRFLMGAQRSDPMGPNYDPTADSDDSPVHVATTPAFFLSKYEMTQGQWRRFTGRNPGYFSPASEWKTTLLHPVEQVTHEDCRIVLSRLCLELPTEIQWERACRAGKSGVYSTGDDVATLRGFANIMGEEVGDRLGQRSLIVSGFDDGFPITAPVGSLKPNAFGLHDMHGNLWEWCEDLYRFYGDEGPPAPDASPGISGARDRVNRGGSFQNGAAGARSAGRLRRDPAFRSRTLGVRPARRIHP